MKEEYTTPKVIKLEFDYANTVIASNIFEEGKNPAQCTSKNPGTCDLGVNPGHGCSNNGNPGNESTGGERKQPFQCI